MSQTFFVVGDRYAAFAEQTGARTVSGLVADVRAGLHRPEAEHRCADTAPDQAGPATLVLAEGQGVTAYDWSRIEDELTRRGLRASTRIVRSDPGPLAGWTETHKHREQNVLIAGLTRVGETTFRAALQVHNDQELQLDHQASHVQGMVILEAARQMYLAVCERFYGSRWPERDYAYVYDRLETTFRNFLFPLGSTIECEVRAADLNDPELLVFDLQIGFEQAGLRIATVRMVGTAFDRALMARKEARGARRALKHALRQFAEPVGAGRQD